MRHNVLVIGCSHLSCAYDKNDHNIGPETYAWHLRKMHGNVDRFVTIPNPAQGIIKYAAIIEHLDRNKLLSQFSHCIIQMTDEPRTVFMDNQENEFYEKLPEFLNTDSDFVDGNKIQTSPSAAVLSAVPRYVFEKYQDKFVQATKLGWFKKTEFDMDMRDNFLDVVNIISPSLKTSNTAKAFLPISYSYIKRTLRRNNIRMASFDWWGKSAEQNESLANIKGNEYILPDDKAIFNLMWEKQLWVREEQSNLGHMNGKQSRQVAEILKEHLDNAYFFE